MDRTVYRFLQFGNDGKTAVGVPHPPTLLKLYSTSSSSSNAATSAGPSPSQSFTETFTQSAAQQARMRCSATRLVSGEQHYLDVRIDSDELLKYARKSSKNQRLRLEEAVEMLFEAFEKREYRAEYDKHSQYCSVTFEGLDSFSLDFDFGRAKKEHITPAFGLAFEASRSFAEEAEKAQAAAQKAQSSLKDKERDAILAEKKASNLKIDLGEARTSLQRLLATGGSSLTDLPGVSRGMRERSTLILDDGENGREASASPGKKRKHAAPTFAKAGRTIQRKVETGFLADQPSSSSSESDGDSAAKYTREKKKKGRAQSSSGSGSDARDKGKGKATARDSESGERSASPVSDGRAAKRLSRPASKSAAAPKPGHTAQIPADKGFLAADVGDSDTEESGSDAGKKKKAKKGNS